MDEGDRCDELVLIRAGRVLTTRHGAEIRQQAGTHDLESAFLKLSGVATGSDARMSRRRIAAIARRVIQQLRRDRARWRC